MKVTLQFAYSRFLHSLLDHIALSFFDEMRYLCLHAGTFYCWSVSSSFIFRLTSTTERRIGICTVFLLLLLLHCLFMRPSHWRLRVPCRARLQRKKNFARSQKAQSIVSQAKKGRPAASHLVGQDARCMPPSCKIYYGGPFGGNLVCEGFSIFEAVLSRFDWVALVRSWC